jgi:hypothetical protein
LEAGFFTVFLGVAVFLVFMDDSWLNYKRARDLCGIRQYQFAGPAERMPHGHYCRTDINAART